MSKTEELMRKIIEYLDSQNWHYKLNEQRSNVIEMSMGIKSKLKSVRMLIVAEEAGIQCFSVCPLNATPDVYPQVVEFITRANYNLKMGKFEFDYNDGEIRYQSYFPCKETDPHIKDIERVVDVPFLMMQHYGDGLAKNLMGFGDPENDVKAIENK